LSISPELDQYLSYLYALERRGIKKGLDHTRRLLTACGNPHHHWDAIHVAGTNGKGSTSAMIASMAREAGLKVGLYTSPHLVRFNERIRVNGQPIDDESILEFLKNTKNAIDQIQATFFETTTALAFWYFHRMKVDVAVVETGLGGRLDSTNVLNPRLTVITPVGWDHREILGSTLTAIAREKGGILKSGVPVVLGAQVPHIRNLFKQMAKVTNSPVVSVDFRSCRTVSINPAGSSFRWRGRTWTVTLIGRHQMENACVALTAMQTLFPHLSANMLANGLEKTHWPGRLERLQAAPPIYYDVAHNSHGLDRVLKSLKQVYAKRPWGLMVLKGDKDLDHLARALKGKFHRLWVSGEPDLGLLSARELSERLTKNGVENECWENLMDALRQLKRYENSNRPGLIFGSHYIAGQVYTVFDKCFDNGVI